MKLLKILFILLITLSFSGQAALAAEGRVASNDELMLLKKDLLAGEIKVGQTRLKKIREAYGDAPKISETEKKITYEYKDLRLDFDKKQYFREWKYDYSHEYGVKDEIANLRFDLEDQQIVGDYYAYREIVKDYEEPTEAYPKKGDGAISVYYWGELKLTFENVVVLSSWRGDKLDATTADGILGTK
jgi:hypothetical protein